MKAEVLKQMNLKKILWVVVVGLAGFLAWGRELPEVLVRFAKTSDTEFRAFLKVEWMKTYAQYQLEEVRGFARPIYLDSLFKKSQVEFLSYNPRSAVGTYQKIIQHIHAFDWTKEERKIIFYSLFRLAQLEADIKKKKLFLEEAVIFGLGLKIDFNIFPPPLTNLYLQLQKSANRVLVNLKKVFPHHELIVINGKEFRHDQKVWLTHGVYRVSAFSSSHASWSRVISLSRLIMQKVNTRLVTDVGGNCEGGSRLHFQTPVKKLVDWKILFPNFCVYSVKDKSNNLKKPSVKNYKLLKKFPVRSSPMVNYWEKHKKPLLIMGGMTLSVVVLYLLLRDNSKNQGTQLDLNNYPIIKVEF